MLLAFGARRKITREPPPHDVTWRDVTWREKARHMLTAFCELQSPTTEGELLVENQKGVYN
jgi:hypothetical protein